MESKTLKVVSLILTIVGTICGVGADIVKEKKHEEDLKIAVHEEVARQTNTEIES